MGFKIEQASVDLLNKAASVVLAEHPAPPGRRPKWINLQFAFDPPHSEGKELDQLKDETKKVLQEALASFG